LAFPGGLNVGVFARKTCLHILGGDSVAFALAMGRFMPAAISSDPPITSAYRDRPLPRNSPNTRMPHAVPQNWFVLESGIPRLMPTYLAAYC